MVAFIEIPSKPMEIKLPANGKNTPIIPVVPHKAVAEVSKIGNL